MGFKSEVSITFFHQYLKSLQGLFMLREKDSHNFSEVINPSGFITH